MQILLLLLLGMAGDHVTGAYITSATAFYFVPVALAGWRGGMPAGLAAALIASGLNVASEWSHPDQPIPQDFLLAGETLRALVLLAVGALGATLGRHQQTILRQRDNLSRLSDRLESEMQATRDIQDLLMLPPPRHESADLAREVRPAQILGGDVVLLSLDPGGRLVIAIADVSGKGCPAALAGAVLIGLLDHAPHRYDSPAETLRYLNARLVERLPEDMFVTVFYGLLDLEGGGLVYANAGHMEPLLLRHSGIPELLPSTGMLLGVVEDAKVDERPVQLAPGDLLFLYTDGATDVRLPAGGRLGWDRLQEQVIARAHLPCEQMLAELNRDVFGEPELNADDITLAAVRFLGPRHPGALEQ